MTRFRRLTTRIGIRKPQSATHSANSSRRHKPAHARTGSGGHAPLIQNLRSARRDHFDIPFASNRIADAVAVGLNAPRTAPRVNLAGATRTFSLVAGLLLAAAMLLPGLASAEEPFHVKTFSNQTTTLGGAPYTQAGGHPDLNTTEFSFPLLEKYPERPLPREVPSSSYVIPPLGFIGNPAAAPRCPLSEVTEPPNANDCPSGSQIGVVVIVVNPTSLATSVNFAEIPLYNLVPENGYPAQFGFRAFNIPTVISAFPPLPRAEAYALTVGTPNIPAVNLMSFSATFCGYGVEGVAGGLGSQTCKSSAGFAGSPFLSNPLDCSKSDPSWSVTVDSAEHAGALRGLGIPDLSDPDWKTATDPAPPVTGCDALLFDPNLATTPLQSGPGPVQADQPTGLRVALDFPQTNDPTDTGAETDSEALQTPPPKDITVKLPAGLSISPSSADGLQACSDQPSDPAGDQVHYDTTNPVTCPDAAKIGTATALSPLLALHDPNVDDDKDEVIGPDPIPGDVYLLKPHPGDLPLGGNSDGIFRLLIELENPRYGVNIKLPGVATADKDTGQLSATFTQNPQLPASHLTVDLKEGARAPLMTPVTCGKYETTSTMVPWGTPDVPNAEPTASFAVGNGSGCPASAAARPFAPSLATAGPDSTKAGASSPFVLHITRPDGNQELDSLDLTLPEGLSAHLAGIPACSDAALNEAAKRSGTAEQANPTCPASRIGSVKVGAGPGPSPFFANGTAYLAGPYKGAPLSVAVITPAVAGPFDLGAIVTRNALFLNPATAQAHVVSDPLPTMLDGIPLRLRDIQVKLDRPDFTLNPTDCTPMSVSATLKSTEGATASPTAFFQVGGCKDLGFKPTLKLSLKGKVSRRAHPSLRAHLTARPGDANIAKAQVKLPKAAFLDNAHIGDVCTRVQFAAKQCPAGSIYGYASATTPLLDYPLTGNVYLRSSNHELPDLVVGFNGPSRQPIEVELAGKTDSVKGALRNTFEAVPDVPVTDFNLTLFGGKKGLIIMSSGFCADPRASFEFTGQNGMESNSTPKVAAKCPKAKGKGARKGSKKNGKEHSARPHLGSLGFPW